MPLAPASSHGTDTSSANVWTANQTAPAWIASGLTGATAASRYVGATASAAPVSGTFSVGDFVIDQAGKVWVCTSAGSPGTWTQVGAGGVTVQSYVQFTSPVAITGTSDAGANTIVTAGAVTFDGSTLATIEFYSPSVTLGATNGANILINIFEDGTSIGRAQGISPASINSVALGVFFRRYMTPASGSRTYSIRGWRTLADGSVGGGAGGATSNFPGYIRVTTGS